MSTDRALPAIEVCGLRKQYADGKVALHGVSLSVQQGEFFGLLGPNGAGKSTLISCLAGIAQPTSGELRILGFDVLRDRRHASMALGVVPQEIAFDVSLTVRQTLKMQSGLYGIPENSAWIDELIERFALTEKRDSLVRSLSGGMKRRVLIAQALVHKPPVVVLDEPTAGVDVELRHQLWDFFQQLNRQGHTIVLTTHYLDEAQALCDRIAIINNGRIAAMNRTAQILAEFGGTELTCRVVGELPETLRARVTARTGNILSFLIADDADLHRILSEAAAAGVRFEDINVHTTTLEDAFVDIIGSTQDEGGNFHG